MKLTTLTALAALGLATPATAGLVIGGVIDGDLTGGNPKAIVLHVTADVPDLSVFGVGSANNGGGTDGEEFTFAGGSAVTGDVLVLASSSANETFFTTNFGSGFTVFNAGGAANINGDDAIELFQSGSVIDTYGDINVNGDGETWDYTDGYAVRTAGTAGAFNQANYTSVFQGLNNLTETEQVAVIRQAFVVPEPASLALLGLGGQLLTRRRRG